MVIISTLARDLYESAKSAEIHGQGSSVRGNQFLIDDLIPPTGEKQGVFSTPDLVYPWFEIKLTKPVLMIGVELSHQDLNQDVLNKVQIRAGLDETPAADGSVPTGITINIITDTLHNQYEEFELKINTCESFTC